MLLCCYMLWWLVKVHVCSPAPTFCWDFDGTCTITRKKTPWMWCDTESPSCTKTPGQWNWIVGGFMSGWWSSYWLTNPQAKPTLTRTWSKMVKSNPVWTGFDFHQKLSIEGAHMVLWSNIFQTQLPNTMSVHASSAVLPTIGLLTGGPTESSSSETQRSKGLAESAWLYVSFIKFKIYHYYIHWIMVKHVYNHYTTG